MKVIRTTLMVLVLLASVPWKLSAQQIWGVTRNGGATNDGTVFKTDANGNNHNIHYNFNYEHTGMDAVGYQFVASDGMVYGLTSRGGNENSGVLYQINPNTNVVTKKFDFSRPGSGVDGGAPGKLVQIGQKLYAVMQTGGANATGGIIEYNLSTGTASQVHSFTSSLMGAYPNPFLVTVNNKLYGTANGGVGSYGVLWEFDPATMTFTKKLDFKSFAIIGTIMESYMVVGPSSKIYFTASMDTGPEVLVEYAAGGTALTIKHTFTSPVTKFHGHKVVTSTGKIYGIGYTSNSHGIVEYDLNTSTLSVKRLFGNTVDEGGGHTGLWFGSSEDILWGHAEGGGTSNTGIVYEYQLSTNTFWKRLDGAGFSYSKPGVCWHNGTGKLFGATTNMVPVSHTSGLFVYNSATATGERIYDFSRTITPGNPVAEFSKSSDGLYYGQTQWGGEQNVGCLAVADLFTTVPPGVMMGSGLNYQYSPTPGLGRYPEGGANLFTNGRMYGITSKGSTHGFGTIYEHYSPSQWAQQMTPMYPFQYDHTVTGSQNGLTTANGKMYGLMAKWNPATAPDGIIYEYAAGVFTVKHNFSSATTGAKPMGKLTLASNGKLYGVTSQGGTNNIGVLFEFNPTTGVYTKRHDFVATTSGSTPIGNLIQASNGKLYGMASAGGANGVGTIYEFDPVTFAFVKKHDFAAANGSTPLGALVQSSNGNLFGTTSIGGSSNLGVLFEYNLSTSTFTNKLNFNGTNGSNPSGGLWFDTGYSKLTQTITFNSLPAKTYGDPPFTISATSTSGLPVTFTSATPSVATVSGNTVTIVGQGVATIIANQAGNATYAAAPTVTQQFAVSTTTQTISFPPLTPRCATGSFTLSATASSGLPVTFVSSDPAHATISGNTVTIPVSWAGNVTITAKQAGNANYTAAPDVPQTLTLYALPVATVGGSSTVCTGISGTFSTEASMSNYTWSAGDGTITGSGNTVGITWPTSGTKTVYVSYTNSNGCNSNTATKNVTLNQSPQPTISGTSSPCVNTTQPYTTASAQSYSWSVSSGGTITSGQNTSSINVKWTATGANTVTLSTVATNGCTALAPTVLPVNVKLASRMLISSPNGLNICSGDVILTATPAGATYLWSTGATAQSIYPATAGNYSVTITLASGCSSTVTAVVSRSPANCPMPAPEFVPALINEEISISPVPADKTLLIEFPSGKKVRAIIYLEELTGRIVGGATVENEERKEIDVSAYGNGMYILRIETDGVRVVRKVLIAR